VPSELHEPPADLPAPNLVSWLAGKPIYRVHHAAYGATEFNPGVGNGRFHPIHTSGGKPIPTIYGSSTVDGALSETVFHDVPIAGPAKRIAQSALRKLLVCTIAPLRDLRLIELKGHGLRKIGLTRALIIDSEADLYDRTRRWAEALFLRRPLADGLIWMSRQHDVSEALLLFGGRVARKDLDVIDSSRSLYPPSTGWLDVVRAAEAAGITIDIA
jgi:hypothetical protein